MAVRLRVPEVDDADFVAEVIYAEGAVLRMSGSADRGAAAALAALFSTLHGELSARATRALVIDLSAVDFMSARCVRELLTWLGAVQELDPARRYQIRLRGNAALAWQRHSLAALACFDTELITVET